MLSNKSDNDLISLMFSNKSDNGFRKSPQWSVKSFTPWKNHFCGHLWHFLAVAVDRFLYSAVLFSTLEQTHRALVACGSKWVAAAFYSCVCVCLAKTRAHWLQASTWNCTATALPSGGISLQRARNLNSHSYVLLLFSVYTAGTFLMCRLGLIWKRAY